MNTKYNNQDDDQDFSTNLPQTETLFESSLVNLLNGSNKSIIK